MIVIRELKEEDLRAAFLINQANVPAVGEETFQSFKALWQCSCVALVIELDSVVEGFCIAMDGDSTYQSPNYLYFKENYKNFIYLDRIALASSAQNQGFGPQLYEYVINHFPSMVFFTLEVNIKPPNEGSLRFHKREGFEVIAEEETRPGKIVALMVKNIKDSSAF